MKGKIVEQNLLPVYTIGIGEIVDGVFVKMPIYCKKNKSNKCDKYYRSLFEKRPNGLVVCPYGFNSYVYNCDGDIEIFTGLRVEGKYNKKKANPKIKREDCNIIIKKKELEKYIEFSLAKDKMIVDNRYLKEFVDNMFHDIRTFNTHIKSKSNMIEKLTDGNKRRNNTVNNYTKNIWAMSEFISNSLNSYDCLYTKSTAKTDINTYKSFDKVKRCYTDITNKKNIRINLIPNGECGYIKVNQEFEVLVFQLIDNAVKYSLNNKNIDISIDDNVEKQIIMIESIAPKHNNNEISQLCNRGFRGNNVRKTGEKGKGIGMHLVKNICMLDKIKMEISSEEKTITTYNDIEYSKFKIKLTIKK